MAQTALLSSGKNYIAQCLSDDVPVILDRFIFAYVPDVDGKTPIEVSRPLPEAAQIKHTCPVTQQGLINDSVVAYSVVLDTQTGDFDFNFIGLCHGETNTLVMALHTDTQTKHKTAGQHQGNTLTQTLWLEINDASRATGITVNAQTWMIDYSARLQDLWEQTRLSHLDIYGARALMSGLKTTLTPTQTGIDIAVSAGWGYVQGVRLELSHPLTATAPAGESTTLYLVAGVRHSVTGASVVTPSIATQPPKDALGVFYYYDTLCVISHDNHAEISPSTYNPVKAVNGNRPAPNVGLITLTAGDVGAYNKAETDTKFNAVKTIAETDATLSQKGRVQLSSAVDSTDETLAATPKAVKDAFDLAHTARWNLPAGIPLPWASPTPPAGWLKCNGQMFDLTQYPKLAIAYPTGQLPDLRGEFIRGFDDGRNVDIDREILSQQAQQVAAHKHVSLYGESQYWHFWWGYAKGRGSLGGGKSDGDNVCPYTNDGRNGKLDNHIHWYDLNPEGLVGDENRPRNVAFLYIVKAEFDAQTGLALNAGFATVYHYHEKTGEFTLTNYEYFMPGIGLPAHSCLDSPQPTEKGKAIVRCFNQWTYPHDHRGQRVYSTETGQQTDVTEIGDIPKGYTFFAPRSEFDSWDGEQWVLDKAKQQAHQIKQRTEEKADLISDANEQIAYLQDAVDVEIATDAEKIALVEWKKYRVLLNRLDVNADNIKFPTPPHV